MKQLAILGSTGSIGKSTLDIVRRHADRFSIVSLAAGNNIDLLAEQIKEFSPSVVSLATEKNALTLQKILGKNKTEIMWGEEGAIAVATHDKADVVVSAFVGALGLKPTLAAIRAKKGIALANKETLVVAGELMMKEIEKNQTQIIPVDSEHSALFQCLVGQGKRGVRKMILTASGGPFRKRPFEDFASITVEDALKHPNWSMGKKITIDSATMMNKGLEVIEASWLFHMPVQKIDVVIHPESIVHSLVEFDDASCLAQLGYPDMRTPIAYALSYPERITSGVASLDLATLSTLHFEAVDLMRFSCLRLAFEAAQQGQSMPAVLNAANEIAVDAFLKQKIGFLDIARIVEETMMKHRVRPWTTLEEVIDIDQETRKVAQTFL